MQENKIWIIVASVMVTLMLSAGGYFSGRLEEKETVKTMCEKVGAFVVNGKVFVCSKG